MQDFILALFKNMLMVKNILTENKLILKTKNLRSRETNRKRKKMSKHRIFDFSEKTTNFKKFIHNKILLMMREHYPL